MNNVILLYDSSQLPVLVMPLLLTYHLLLGYLLETFLRRLLGLSVQHVVDELRPQTRLLVLLGQVHHPLDVGLHEQTQRTIVQYSPIYYNIFH